ncbi:spore coat protein CotF [Clostridium acetobutylicum]|uniref:Spore coat protein F n=1 Tax=Clostridium acetobutylicum (strain ATCC 824 / DSM 792 / JCM 1419 / IAM 19013 / LMG 5710 / NBRC 13948 / NRRL B-527 / VKM B-1787 / 2291 / W) TaxID=272562 RepID=Q97LE7_CLOAB|nr:MULTISPECIES: spore coat protein CotF [Clostridium]AAK78592.1 Spore coat protein F [Clostridium acetobutylicum ATCC 824]ADZ19665.1 Spore coat protein F [Clostridium acetobutylicum EA 2018]AEI31336.1 spore coat protein F [Clostridium acetobutylicum DSM 1731]AWV80316.1 hypothetical protein DK921_09445 [Clostridium acetobutylicum]MBC2392501.1 hypothetical protein [Clostridium acetobutylicum]
MQQPKLGVHETMELHELLTFKNLCLTKTTVMTGLVSDPNLKSILQDDISTTKRQIGELKELIKDSDMCSPEGVMHQ